MCGQFLDDVQLPTVQEVQTMIENCVVSEETIDNKIEVANKSTAASINIEKGLREAGDAELAAQLQSEVVERKSTIQNLSTNISDEAKIREETDNALQKQISREEGVREAADDEIIKLVKAEATEREKADNEVTKLVKAEAIERERADAVIIEELKNTEQKVFEDRIFCSRLSKLPIAQITLENLDKTIKVGDILGSVSARFLPLVPITFSFISEVVSGYAHVSIRLDANGNAVVINITELAEAYEGNIGSETIMYFTKE